MSELDLLRFQSMNATVAITATAASDPMTPPAIAALFVGAVLCSVPELVGEADGMVITDVSSAVV